MKRRLKSHYNSRVSLHEAPTKNTKSILTMFVGGIQKIILSFEFY